MSLLFFDQPAAYSTATGAQRWTNFGGGMSVVTTPIPRSGSACLESSFFSAAAVSITLGGDGSLLPSGAVAILGCRYRSTGIFSSSSGIATVFTVLDAGSAQITVTLNADGTCAVRRGGFNGTVLGNTTFPIALNTFYFITLKVTIHPSTGTIDLYIDGVNRLSLTGQNTRATANSTWNGFSLGFGFQTGGVLAQYWTDIYALDGVDGTTISPAQLSAFNTPLGDRKVEWLVAQAGNGSNVGFTRSTGSDSGANVDDTAPNGDTDYNFASVVGTKDSYNLSNLASTSVTIEAVATLHSCTKNDAGSRTFTPLLRIGGTDFFGAAAAKEAPSSGTYRYLAEIFTASPATGVAFTPTEVNAMEVGQKIVA